MTDDLRERVLAAVRKGLATAPDTSRWEKRCEECEVVDSATKKGVRETRAPHTTFTNKIKDLTPSHRLSANSDVQPGIGGHLRVIEVPARGPLQFRKVLALLATRCPALVSVERWQQAVEDGRAFLAQWGKTAAALGWTPADVFGLHKPPAEPHPSYSRLSRYDCTGLVWLLQGKTVIALTTDTATIRNPTTGNVTVYRKNNRPALGPLGDSLDDVD